MLSDELVLLLLVLLELDFLWDLALPFAEQLLQLLLDVPDAEMVRHLEDDSNEREPNAEHFSDDLGRFEGRQRRPDGVRELLDLLVEAVHQEVVQHSEADDDGDGEFPGFPDALIKGQDDDQDQQNRIEKHDFDVGGELELLRVLLEHGVLEVRVHLPEFIIDLLLLFTQENRADFLELDKLVLLLLSARLVWVHLLNQLIVLLFEFFVLEVVVDLHLFVVVQVLGGEVVLDLDPNNQAAQ